jgi:hypothetical protein
MPQLNTNVISATQQAYLNQLAASPAISPNAVSGFQAVPNSTTNGVDVSFTMFTITGISSITLLRNFVNDIGTATVINSWTPPMQADYAWSDTDSQLQATAEAYYWLSFAPVGATGKTVTAGPQIILLNPQLIPPNGAKGISASAQAAVNGETLITVNVAFISASVKIYVSRYHGQDSYVAVADSYSTPVQFNLDVTGETVSLKAVAVSAGGIEASSAPTAVLTLNGIATVPATPEGVVVNQISTGNQISFPASKDNVTSYNLFRGQYGTIFSVATLLANTTTTVSTVNYLDSAGLGGNYQYFIVAVNGTGSSLPSAAAFPLQQYSSAGIPANVPSNTTNNATVDSIDSGTSALVRVYGPGGVGTSYLHYTGFGSVTRPPGTVSGLGYATTYCVLWTGSALIAVTAYPETLPDNYEFIATIITTSATGTIHGSGAQVTLTINGTGNITAAAPTYVSGVAQIGSTYVTATVTLSGGGGGSDGQIMANVNGSGQVSSYTVVNQGIGYTVAPTGTVVGGGSTGTPGGGSASGGSGGSRIGCVEEGTDVAVPEGTTEELEACNEWVIVDVGSGPLVMHPDTLVSVFVKAKELTPDSRIELKNGRWSQDAIITTSNHEGVKVKRTCPGGVYHAGPSKIRLHNVKPDLS